MTKTTHWLSKEQASISATADSLVHWETSQIKMRYVTIINLTCRADTQLVKVCL